MGRVTAGEAITAVARDLEIGPDTRCGDGERRLWNRVEDHLRGVGRPRDLRKRGRVKNGSEEKIAELERLVGRQQMEIRFLDRALRRIEELRQEKNDDGGAASTKR